MKLGRIVDYHGSRSYGADGPRTGLFSAIMDWLANLGRRTKAKSADGLPPSAQRGYSLLGESSPAPARRPADCPFPVKPGDFERRDWRLLP